MSEQIVTQQPSPGDAVVLTSDHDRHLPAGSIGVLERTQWCSEGALMAVFNTHGRTFRGAQHGILGGPEVVECTGGPCLQVEVSALQPTDETYNVGFWRWQDIPRAHGGVAYTLDVPLWKL